MIIVSVYMALRQRAAAVPTPAEGDLGRFGACYYDRSFQREVCYRPRRMWAGLLASFVAGNVFRTPGGGRRLSQSAGDGHGHADPPRAAVSTSSFMIGVTACAGSVVYLVKGLVDPVVVVPVVLGVAAGAYIGSKLTLRIRSSVLVTVLAVILFILSVQMILSAAGINIR